MLDSLGGGKPQRVVLVDLNNFASFPTLAIGLITAALRNAGFAVQVICPLAHDVPGALREKRETLKDHVRRRLSLSTWRPARGLLDRARVLVHRWKARPHRVVLREIDRVLATAPDVLLLSAYLQHEATIRRIAARAKARDVPVLLGGPMFNIAGVSEDWRTIPGLVAIFGGEADVVASDLEAAVCAGDDLLRFDGVTLPDGRRSRAAAPLRPLRQVPVPDFTDFPWDRYPNRIVPLMAGRGCQWARCLFCSDVVSANGRGFRTRGVGDVLAEMREQARRHASTNFLFLDLKLNSDPNMLRGLAEGIQREVPGAEWVGTVHVDLRRDNGLSRRELRACVAAGMRRISFGLESGSQRMLDAMVKGSSVEANAAFVRDAHAAGLSVRCTMFKGFPGETAEDMDASAAFLEEHEARLDRVRFNEFAIIEGTPIYETLTTRSDGDVAIRAVERGQGRAWGRLEGSERRAYRRAKARLLAAVYRINRKPIRRQARAFDGLM
ncbi:MAG: B12-binding domain-containing radical SAM protein [Paracoccaceae bacterium]